MKAEYREKKRERGEKETVKQRKKKEREGEREIIRIFLKDKIKT